MVSWAIAVILPAAAAYILVFEIDWQEHGSPFSEVRALSLLVPLALYAALSMLKALRWAILVGGGLRWRDYYSVSSMHNVCSQLVPLGIGEFSFVYLFGSRHGLPAGKGLLALGVGRIFDSVVLLCLCGAVAAVVYGMWPLAIVAAAVIVAVGILTGPLARRSAPLAGRLAARCRRSTSRILSAAAAPLDHAREALEAGLRGWRVLGVTVASLLLIAAFTATLTRAFVPEAPWGPVIVASMLVPLGTVIPLRGFGGFGNIEGLWAGAFHLLMGMPLERGFAVGLGMHVVMLVLALGSGLIGFGAGRVGEPKRFDTGAGGGTISSV